MKGMKLDGCIFILSAVVTDSQHSVVPLFAKKEQTKHIVNKVKDEFDCQH